jgi:hypothetical protein
MNRPALVFALFSVSIAPCIAKGPIQTVQVENWQGGSYTDDSSGAFSHCAAYVSYPGSNSDVFVSVVRDYSWRISFMNPLWNFELGRNISVAISFDRVGPFQLNANPIQNNLIVVPMPNSDVAIQAFKAARTMHLTVGGQLNNFDLSSSSALLSRLAQCVADNLQTPPVAAASPALPAPPSAPQSSTEVDAARNKLLADTTKEYDECIQNQMKQLVPLSNEGAETLAQVITTKCEDIEQRYVELSIAMYGVSRAQVEDAIHDSLEKRKKNIVADIVTFRAELAKALLAQPKGEDATEAKKDQGL